MDMHGPIDNNELMVTQALCSAGTEMRLHYEIKSSDVSPG